MAKKMMKGNVAIAEAAIRAGCTFYAGYPITPQTEVMETLSYRMAEEGRTFIQAENEISAINMVMGSVWTGERSLTSSSGPGISLKQEGMSYISNMQFPAVVLNVMRWGVGLGGLDSAQTDYLRETRGGGHGDYRCIVMAPSSIQESVDMMYEAFDVAEEYQNIVVILSEASIGQMMEAVDMPEYKEVRKVKTTGSCGRPGAAYTEKFTAHQNRMKDELQRWEEIQCEDAEHIFVAFGIPSRVCMDAVDTLRSEGYKVGLIRPINVWPFPFKAFENRAGLKSLISIETTETGQLVEDVALAAKKAKLNIPVYALCSGGVIATEEDIISYFKKTLDKTVEEVF